MTACEVPMKFALVRNGEVTETRRVRLVSPTLEAVLSAVSQWTKGDTMLQYTDDEGDVVTMDTEEEWGECLRLWTGGPLHLRLILPSVDGGHGRWWRRSQRNRCRSRSRSRSRSRGSPRRRMGDMFPSSTAEQEDDIQAPSEQQAAVVGKVLRLLHGEETMAALAEGGVDAKTLGCDSWLTVSVLGDGEVDLDVKVRALYRMMHRRGLEAMAQGNEEAVTWLELCNELCPTAARGWYNLACALLVVRLPMRKGEAQEEVKSAALDALETAKKCGYQRWGHMVKDEDLVAVRSHPRFLAMLPQHGRWGAVVEVFSGQETMLEPPCKQGTVFEPEPVAPGLRECKKAMKMAKKEAKAEAKAVKAELKAEVKAVKAEAKAIKKMEKIARKQGSGVVCEREGCGFEVMEGKAHCCGGCRKGKGHGKKCARNHLVMPTAPPAPVTEVAVEKVPTPLPVTPEMVYAEQIATLQGMGFTINEAMLAALQEHNGELVAVVNSML